MGATIAAPRLARRLQGKGMINATPGSEKLVALVSIGAFFYAASTFAPSVSVDRIGGAFSFLLDVARVILS